MQKPTQNLLSTPELAQALNVSPATISRYRRCGCPVAGLGDKKANLFDLAVVRKWMAETGKTGKPGASHPSQNGAPSAKAEIDRHKARKERVLADRAELELAEKRGELVLRSEIAAQQAAKVVVLRSRLQRVWDSIEDAETRERVRVQIESLCRDFGRGINGIEPTRDDVEAAARLLGIE